MDICFYVVYELWKLHVLVIFILCRVFYNCKPYVTNVNESSVESGDDDDNDVHLYYTVTPCYCKHAWCAQKMEK